MSAPSADPATLLALRRVAERIVETVEEETAQFVAGRIPDGGYAERKALLLLELIRAARGGLEAAALAADPELRLALIRLQDAVARNQATLGLHLDAARRVAETLKRLVADVESDGTYAATSLVRAPMR
ncbi:MAG: hypothetical protein JNK46_00215 [Methylobacteriaceae bacterium]|nr:hypothetical protein [Methylobacteriaceae bacterium]